ncbi:unnamed protein product (macronuclear) [Paramecium tetraurelia]|uniref:N-formylglutamate amidohydrolase n=1 Tax=Paramecium tetraurelia TaxID=5888 RepID=A0CV13_PARTE|nr:uncharacterized protein GSPATT00010798001 [Paramecium tetraurelia]CAK74630.1 unnamed protein product [Paramecium tetraurelia]|eukprot:XP_001442027.1 hypothetical protein (macronuclear) [Paramecium tetraurelia strain d4-2]
MQKQIYKQYENSDVVKYGNNVGLLFTCDHATNVLPQGHEWSEEDQRNFANTHWAVDIGALNLAKYLANHTESTLVNSKYSRLYCDVNRQIQSESLFRQTGDNQKIELNQNLSLEEQWIRIQYHSNYHFEVRQAIHELKPKFIYSIHSFTPEYEGKKRDVEIGILTSLFDEFGEAHQQILKNKGYDCRVNEPYTGKKGLNYSIDCACLTFAKPIVGTLFEVRNDILSNPERFAKVSADILATILEVIGKWK